MIRNVLEHREIARLSAALAARPAQAIDAVPGEATLHAAVTILLRPNYLDELELLLIKRAEFEGDPWSGHVALPGGRREPVDQSLERTALRETWEETAIDVARDGAVLGVLDDVSPRSMTVRQVIVRPFVAAVLPGVEIVESPEVAAAFWVPLATLRDTAAWITAEVVAHGRSLRVPAFTHGEYVVWGLTERILRCFLGVVGE
ncbi:MAG: CoA pyrophosphatase [Gemmatimonadaceae bacterium]|nr:CoA pyrophosphatase [Gemmatimonadaceae bacterium]NUQ94204.1 CoA pyrophosphatase [Gemmatimonadaceae bacterium]NUR21051.1 CoA pyrophosphatase [Gemmatimonadaceae bacterium]NUS99272.1 CoA pyrophosphatase [Gemmatimonadaceae bacterium]